MTTGPGKTHSMVIDFKLPIWCCLVWCCLGFANSVLSGSEPRGVKDNLEWHDASSLHLEGQAWSETASRYDRLPAKAETQVRPAVWGLAQNSAGLSVRFATNAPKISARWVLRNQRIALPHMPATGASGLDLYVQKEGAWRFLAVGKPTAFPLNQSVLVQGLTADEKEYRLYFPLYNGVDKLEIGLPEGSTFQPRDPVREVRPVVFYGTSITQGGCASRPGMAYPAILSRRLEIAAVNLGFSGNGKCEPEIAALLAEIDAAAYVLDCLPNLETAEAVKRLPVFFDRIRSSRPRTPVILVENLKYTNSPFVAERAIKEQSSNEFLRQLYSRLRAAGDERVFLVRSDELIGDDGEATVDALHPTDLGFVRMADVLEPVIRAALEASATAEPQR